MQTFEQMTNIEISHNKKWMRGVVHDGCLLGQNGVYQVKPTAQDETGPPDQFVHFFPVPFHAAPLPADHRVNDATTES